MNIHVYGRALQWRAHRLRPQIKGELNLHKKWQSDDLFYVIINEIHHRFNQF